MSQLDSFVERARETRIFRDWFQNQDARKPRIFFLYSEPRLEKKGGLGKTWLLRHFLEIAQQQEECTVVMIDFLNIDARGGEVIAKRVVEALSKSYPTWDTSPFNRVYEQYESFLETEQVDVSQRVGEDLRRKLRFTMQQCMEALKPYFAETKKRVIIFFDTFEIIGKDISSVLLQNGLEFPDDYGFSFIDFVIAGREAPDLENLNWKDRVQLLAVQPFSSEEMLHYYHHQLGDSENYEQVAPYIERVQELTQGRPILMSLIGDLFSRGVFGNRKSFAELLGFDYQHFEKQLVSLIGNMGDLENMAVLAMAHVHHRFNLDLFMLIFDEKYPKDEILLARSYLLRYSFIREAYKDDNNSDIVLHDEMRELVNKYNWRDKDEASLRREFSAAVIPYYDMKIADSMGWPTMQQTYIVEQLYHKFFLPEKERSGAPFLPQDGWHTFEMLFKEATQKWQLGYARSLLREVRKPEIQALLNGEQKAALELHEIGLLRKEERYPEALERCERLKKRVDQVWLEGHGTDLTFEMGECYRFVNRFDDARRQFGILMQIDDDKIVSADLKAEASSRIGSIHEQLANFDHAIISYQRSLEIFRKEKRRGRYVDVLNHLSLVHYYEGNFEEAQQLSLGALSICRETKVISPALRADSFSMAAMVYIHQQDFDTALHYIREAQDICENLRHKHLMATTYLIHGDLDLTKGNYANARLWFEKSYRTALFTSADIEIKSLYGLARIDAAQQLWDDAMKNLEKARERAVLIQNLYQEIQAQLMQVDILLDRRYYGEAHDLYQKVCVRVQPLKSYYRLLAGIEHKMALIYYAKPDYAEAFSHFGRFCSYMARCTEEEFKNSVNETCKYMLVLEAKEIAVLFNRFKQYYMEQLAGYIARDERKVAFFQKKLGELQDLVDLYSI